VNAPVRATFGPVRWLIQRNNSNTNLSHHDTRTFIMRVDFLHNTTREDGRMAIFSRFSSEGPVTRPGDTLEVVGSIDLEDMADPANTAEKAFEVGNSPYSDQDIDTYRSWRVRSLSMGDAVRIHTPDGVVVLACLAVGWTEIDPTEYDVKEKLGIAPPPDHTFAPRNGACTVCGYPERSRRHESADVVVNGTYYGGKTPAAVVEILELYRNPGPANRPVDKVRLVLEYGDPETGKSWGDTETGYIGRSTGTQPIPLVIPNSASTGGDGVLDHCIVRIRTALGKHILWSHPTYTEPDPS
jgi:hypothetical protein